MIVDVKDASFRLLHGGRFDGFDFSVSASTGLRDHFSHQWGCPLGAIKCSRGAHQIFIDGLGTQEALLTSPSRIIEGGNNQNAPECY